MPSTSAIDFACEWTDEEALALLQIVERWLPLDRLAGFVAMARHRLVVVFAGERRDLQMAVRSAPCRPCWRAINAPTSGSSPGI